MIEPIAKELLRKLRGYHYEILGPFGLGNRTSIHFYKNGVDEAHRYDRPENCMSITFEPRFGDGLGLEGLDVVDYSVDTGHYSKGTLGEMNGFNHPTVTVPNNASVDWLMNWVK